MQECILSQTLAHRQYLGRRVLGVKPSARGPYVLLRCAWSENVSDVDTSLRLVAFIHTSHCQAFTDLNPDLTGSQDTNSRRIDAYSCDYHYTRAS